MKRRFLIWAGALVGTSWLLAFVVLGLRRWGCSLPWRQACLTELGSQAERAILFLWVTDRETLVSAGLAVAAAAIGAWFLHRQIRQSDRQDRERRKREHRAARAMLPLALSEVCDFAQAHAREWLRLRDHGHRVDDADDGEVIEPIEPDFPRVREETLQIFRQIIASAPRRKTRHFEDLLGEIQVSIARSRRIEAGANDRHRRSGDLEVFNQIVELAEVYAKAIRLFDYARREGPLPTEDKPSRLDIRSAIRAMGWWEPEGAEIWERFNARYPAPRELES